MVDLGELIGGIMSGVTRARRDADLASALVAEEYKIHSLLSSVSAPRVRLAEIEIDLPVILSTANGANMQKRSASAMTSETVVQALTSNLQKEGVSDATTKRFIHNVQSEFDTLFGGEVRGISGEAISRIAQHGLSTAYNEKAKGEEDDEKPLERVRAGIDLEARRIGRELTHEWPIIDAIAETQTIKDMGSEASITRLKLKMIEEGLEWTSTQDEQGNKISRLMSE